jgi:hypothetical protein
MSHEPAKPEIIVLRSTKRLAPTCERLPTQTASSVAQAAEQADLLDRQLPPPTYRTNGSESPNVDMAKLCSNEKLANACRFFGMHGYGTIDTSFQPYPVTLTHMDHFHVYPVPVNFFDLCQLDIYEGLLTFHP